MTHQKTITVNSDQTGITDLSVMLGRRTGVSITQPGPSGGRQLPWVSRNVSLNTKTVIEYGDDENPFLDAVAVSYTEPGTYGTQKHFSVGGDHRGTPQDDALNQHDTFVINIVNGRATMECLNSNGQGGTVPFPE
ncbi:MAG: hypothetical protein AAF467_20395 [Actinomycetota bacterium]